MPTNPKECRERASRCIELADRATDGQLKEILKTLARRWQQLALEQERAQALRHPGEPMPKQ